MQALPGGLVGKWRYEPIRMAVAEVLDPATLAYVALLHWEGDEAGGLDRWIEQAPNAQVVGSDLSILLNLRGFGVPHRSLGMRDGDTLDLGRHKLRVLETPHVHHWDSMMVVEETTKSLFPADLFLQPGDQPPTVTENLGDAMSESYRAVGIFADERPVREVVDRIEPLELEWVHAMTGGSLTRDALPYYVRALREQEFAWRGVLLGRELAPAPVR